MNRFSRCVSSTCAIALLFGLVTSDSVRGADPVPQIELKLLAEGFTAPIALARRLEYFT